MEPISSLPAELAQRIRGVAFDIDDTVTTDGVLDPEAYAALCELREAGLYLLALTGRPLGWAEVVARTWPVHAAVGENGAGWMGLQDGRLAHGYFEPEAMRARNAARLESLRRELARHFPAIQRTEDAWARRCDLAYDIGEFDRVPPAQVQTLVERIEAAGAHAVVSTVHAHATFSAVDKPAGAAGAARQLLDIELSDERDRWLFVGDSGNDAAAFAWFPVCAGVANVRDVLDQLPVPPRFVAQGRCGAGFAEIARALLERRAPGVDGQAQAAARR